MKEVAREIFRQGDGDSCGKRRKRFKAWCVQLKSVKDYRDAPGGQEMIVQWGGSHGLGEQGLFLEASEPSKSFPEVG